MADPEIYNNADLIPPPLPARKEPAWGYADLALFIGALLPTVLLASILLFLTGLAAPRVIFNSAARQLTLQSFLYLLLLGILYLIVTGRYHEPFWKALGWTFPVPRAWLCVLVGPVLAVALSVAGVLLKAPAENSLIEDLITNRASLALFIVFGVIFAPIFEELLFRGFLLPLLARSLGPARGIAIAAIAFGLLHGAQNHWAWQPILLIGAAGAAFGYARYRTGSTTAGFMMHAAYNATAFAGFTVSHWRILN
jgi:membrane protease YdiL (CAAX protease family)